MEYGVVSLDFLRDVIEKLDTKIVNSDSEHEEDVSYGPCHNKTCLGGFRKSDIDWLYRLANKVADRCAGWSAPVLFEKPQRQVFSRQGPYRVDPFLEAKILYKGLGVFLFEKLDTNNDISDSEDKEYMSYKVDPFRSWGI